MPVAIPGSYITNQLICSKQIRIRIWEEPLGMFLGAFIGRKPSALFRMNYRIFPNYFRRKRLHLLSLKKNIQ